jgi:hypothetical protein
MGKVNQPRESGLTTGPKSGGTSPIGPSMYRFTADFGSGPSVMSSIRPT